MINKYNRNSGSLVRTSFLLFLITLCFAPLAFGTSETWSLLVVEIVVALTGIFFFCSPSCKTKSLYKIPGLLPLVLLVFLMGLQCIPLPSQLVQFISPNIYQIYAPLIDLQHKAIWIPLTVHYQATLFESLRITTYMLFYVLTVQLLSRSTRLKFSVNLVVILSAGISFLAIIQKFISPHKIYGLKEIPKSAWQGALGPWVNPNQYAGFMVMVCPLLLALFIYLRPAARSSNSIKDYFVSMLATRGASLRLLFAFCITLMFATIFLSHSRGGIISICCASALFFFILSQKNISRVGFYPILLIVGLLSIAASLNWNPMLQKFLSTISSQNVSLHDGRINVWLDSLKIVRDFPLTGSGFGTFPDLYPLYKSFKDIYFYNHAHNDYLELFTDGGIAAFMLTGWFVLTILKTGWKQIQLRRDQYSILVTTGALSALAGILFYSITDFNLHNGANGLYFFFLCGLVVSAGHTRHHYQHHPTLLQTSNTPKKKRAFFCLASVSLLVATVYVMGGNLAAQKMYTEAENISKSMMRPKKKRENMIQLLKKARQYDPFSAQYDYALSNLMRDNSDKERALYFCLSAIKKQPTEGVFFSAAGSMFSAKNSARAQEFRQIGKLRERGK